MYKLRNKIILIPGGLGLIGSEISKNLASEGAKVIVLDLKKRGIICPSPEGRPQCDWVIVDVGTIIVHLFSPKIREYYNLEKFWDMSFDLIENKLA